MTKEGQGRRRPTLPPGVAVPSAQTGLTSLFGMERGGPRRHGHLDLKYFIVGCRADSTEPAEVQPKHDICWDGAPHRSNKKQEVQRLIRTAEGRCASIRAISTARLHMSPCFHLRPIDVVISHGPLKKSHLVAGFALICFQRLSHPDLATQRCPWRDNWCTSGRSSSVLSY